MSKFKKAEKKKAKLRLGISGPSGSGKTYGALRIAKGMGLKTAVVDSEKGSASLYADWFNFDVLEIEAPYTVEKYIEAWEEAVKEGYEVIITDSVSHAWSGSGGILQRKEQVDARGGNSFTNWSKFTPQQEKFIASIISSKAHMIVTMRSKQDYSVNDSGGKTKIQKIGLAPVQREGFEYELTTVFDVAMNHEAETSKDRTGLFVDRTFQITEQTGVELLDWLNSGKELIDEKPVEKPVDKPITTPKVEQTIDLPSMDASEPMPETGKQETEKPVEVPASNRIPNKARGIYVMKSGKYNGMVIGKMKEIELRKYVQQCLLHEHESGTSLPLPVIENIEAIKEYLGIE